jgi:hypothetical protein
MSMSTFVLIHGAGDVGWYWHLVEQPQLDALAAAVSLRTWPEGSPVDLDLGSWTRSDRAELEVKPQAALPDRWYFLGLSSLPAGFVWSVVQLRHRAADGTTGVRFRPGSEPHVRAVHLCEKEARMQKIIVDTSESVLATRALTDVVLLVHAGRVAPTCRSLEDRDGAGGVRVDLVCDGVDPATPLEVRVGSGLFALDGSTALVPATLSFVPSTLPNISGCRTYAAPDP